MPGSVSPYRPKADRVASAGVEPWLAKAVVIAGTVGIAGLPHLAHRHERSEATAGSRKGALETALLSVTSIAFLLAILWVATPVLAFADYPFGLIPLVAGTACMALGLWLLYRSHSDLGASWSITLEVRENQRLVAEGIYRRIRHPMYLALLTYSFGQALVLPNWVAGPSCFAAFVLLVALRMSREERMMAEEFGGEYVTYAARTKRLVPGVW